MAWIHKRKHIGSTAWKNMSECDAGAMKLHWSSAWRSGSQTCFRPARGWTCTATCRGFPAKMPKDGEHGLSAPAGTWCRNWCTHESGEMFIFCKEFGRCLLLQSAQPRSSMISINSYVAIASRHLGQPAMAGHPHWRVQDHGAHQTPQNPCKEVERKPAERSCLLFFEDEAESAACSPSAGRLGGMGSPESARIQIFPATVFDMWNKKP